MLIVFCLTTSDNNAPGEEKQRFLLADLKHATMVSCGPV